MPALPKRVRDAVNALMVAAGRQQWTKAAPQKTPTGFLGKVLRGGNQLSKHPPVRGWRGGVGMGGRSVGQVRVKDEAMSVNRCGTVTYGVGFRADRAAVELDWRGYISSPANLGHEMALLAPRVSCPPSRPSIHPLNR